MDGLSVRTVGIVERKVSSMAGSRVERSGIPHRLGSRVEWRWKKPRQSVGESADEKEHKEPARPAATVELAKITQFLYHLPTL